MRGSVRRHRTIEVSADAAWAVIGRPELLHHWFPGIVECTLAGTTRTITTGVGLRFVEDLLTVDPLTRRFQYRITGHPFREHLATLDVYDLGPSRCLVAYATDADPAAMAVILGGAMAGALDELARQLESGGGPAVDAVATAGAPVPLPLLEATEDAP